MSSVDYNTLLTPSNVIALLSVFISILTVWSIWRNVAKENALHRQAEIDKAKAEAEKASKDSEWKIKLELSIENVIRQGSFTTDTLKTIEESMRQMRESDFKHTYNIQTLTTRIDETRHMLDKHLAQKHGDG